MYSSFRSCVFPLLRLSAPASFRSCVAVAALTSAFLFLPSTARAGSWQFTCTGSGSDTYTSAASTGTPPYVAATWTPPGPQTGSFQLLAGQGRFGNVTCYRVSNVATISVTVTATWMPASGQSAATDPAPPSVWLYESAQTEWAQSVSGSAADGLGETASGATGSGSANSSSAPYSLPPAHWTNYPVINGQATLPTRTLRAEGDSPATASSPYGNYTAAFIDNYSVMVHPTPYNWHIISAVPNSNGTLTFQYGWSSTDGAVIDLTSCYAHENVTYPGPQGTALFPIDYTMPAPFYGTIPNPYVHPGIGANGIPLTGQIIPTDDQKMPALSAISPHIPGGFTGTQTYQFDDTATGQTNVTIPGPDSGPLSIVRSVYSPDGINWFYSLTKSGDTITQKI